MGSSHYGELYLGNGRSGSSRRGKKSNTDKPKQPQRGLGVAQLEKIRLYNQMMAGYLPSLHPPFQTNLTKEDARHMGFPSSPHASSIATSSSLFGVHPNTMVGFGGSDRTDIKFGDHYSDAAPSSSYMMPPHHVVQAAVTLPLLTQTMEDSMQEKIQHDQCHSMGSISPNSDSSDSKELDLELKLSL